MPPHPSEYSNGAYPTLPDFLSGAVSAREYVASLGDRPGADEPSTPATSSLIVPTKAEAGRVLRNPRSTRFGGVERKPQTPQEVDNEKAIRWARAQREAREQLAAERRPADPVRKSALREAFLTRSQAAEIPELEPLIDGWLYRETLAQMFGPSGHYKSFVALDMATAVALGRPWFGHEVKQGRVCYIVAEGVRGFEKRIRAAEATRERGRIPDDALTVVKRAVQIGGPEWAEFVEIIAEEAYSMVVIDTQARATVGRNENASEDMGEVVHALDWLIEATGVGTLLIHHSGKKDADDGRGSTAIKGALQSQIRVTKRSGLTVEVKAMKQKDHDEIGPYYLQFEEVEGSLALSADRVKDGMAPDRTDRTEREQRDLRRLLDVTELAAVQHGEAIRRVLAATYGGGKGATKAEVKKTYTDLMQGSERPVPHSSFEKAWSGVEGSGHLLRNPDEKRFVLGAEGCKAIGAEFKRPAWVSEDEWEEAQEAIGGADYDDIEV